MIRYKCVKCRADLDSPSSMAGQEDKCPLCGTMCLVPHAKNRLPLVLGLCGGLALLAVIAVVLVLVLGRTHGGTTKEAAQNEEGGGSLTTGELASAVQQNNWVLVHWVEKAPFGDENGFDMRLGGNDGQEYETENSSLGTDPRGVLIMDVGFPTNGGRAEGVQ